MLRKIAKRVLFGKRKNYRRFDSSKYVTWFTYNQDMNAMNATINNLLSKLELKRIGNGNLIGDKKDAKTYTKTFESQWS